jgi:ATP-dependent protease HslVU (ClpYQ) ATPase subunit
MTYRYTFRRQDDNSILETKDVDRLLTDYELDDKLILLDTIHNTFTQWEITVIKDVNEFDEGLDEMIDNIKENGVEI